VGETPPISRDQEWFITGDRVAPERQVTSLVFPV
jgi:hypothetical protein